MKDVEFRVIKSWTPEFIILECKIGIDKQQTPLLSYVNHDWETEKFNMFKNRYFERGQGGVEYMDITVEEWIDG